MIAAFLRYLKVINRHPISKILFLIFLFIFPLISGSRGVSLGFIALQYALFALGLNIVVGWTGLLDLGAAGFVAVGAYTTAILLTQFKLSVLLVIPLTFIIGYIFGIILGIPTLRHRSDYFAILTLGFAELVALAVRNWPALTKGSYGYSGIPAISLPLLNTPFKTVPPTGFYYLALVILVPSYFLVRWLRLTRVGKNFHIIKHSEDVAKVYGINVLFTKLIAFGTSAAFISVGGFFWASYQRSIVWTEFGVLLSCMILSLLVVGGLGNIKGVIFGAALVGTSLEILRGVLTDFGLPQNIRFLVFSILLVIFIHLRSKGLLPDSPKWLGEEKTMSMDLFTWNVKYAGKTQEAGKNLIEIKEVTKKFDGVTALKELSLSINQKETLALIGPNGSGKTTLLNLMCGLVRPDEGSIWIDDNRIDKLPAFLIARLGVARSFQNLEIFEDLNIQDNVYIPNFDTSALDVKRILEQFDLPSGEKRCADLPYGNKKILDLARVFLNEKMLKIVLLDEPTAGLSQDEGKSVIKSIFELKKKMDVSLIVVSHDVMFLENLEADKVAVLNQGILMKEGTFTEIRNDPSVKKLFWGD